MRAWLDASLRHRLWFSETDEHDGASLPFALVCRGDMAISTFSFATTGIELRSVCSAG